MLFQLEQPRILLVDDDPNFQVLLSDFLSLCGFTVQVAGSAKIAYQAIKTKLPDLVLVDVCLPNENGYEFTKSLKAKLPFLPVVIVTARVSPQDQRLALESGSSAYVRKPFECEELAELLSSTLAIQYSY